MKQSLAKWYKNGVLDHPWPWVAVMAALVLFSALFVPRFRLDSGSDSLVLENDAALRYFNQTRDDFKESTFLVVAFQPEQDLFAPETRAKLRALVDALAQVKGVKSVNSLLNAPLLLSPPLSLTALFRGVPTLEDERVDQTMARKELTESPFYRDQLISRDGRSSAIQLVLEENSALRAATSQRNRLRYRGQDQPLSGEEQATLAELEAQVDQLTREENARQEQLVAAVRSILAQHRDGVALYLGGLPMIVADMMDFVRRDIVVFGAGMLGFLALALWVVFRSKRFVFLPLLTCLATVVTMIGLLGFFGSPATVISSNFISLLLIIGMSMAIHIAVRFDDIRAAGETRAQLKQAVIDVALPCFFCCTTTMVGFGSLIFSGIKPVIDFGLMMTVGIVVAYAFIFLLLAPLLVLTTAVAENDPGAAENDTNSALMAWLARLTDQHGGLLLTLALIVLGLSVWACTFLSVENRFIDYFHQDTEIHQGMLLIDQKLGGTVPLEIMIEGDRKNYWVDGEHRTKLRKAHQQLEAMSAVGKVLSFDASLQVAEQLTGGGQLNNFMVSLLKTALPAHIREAVLEPYIDDDFRTTRIIVRVVESDPNLQRQALLDGIRTTLVDDVGFAPEQIHFTGMYVLYNNMLQSLFDSQIKTMGVVFLAVFIMFLILFRSLPVAIIALIPNIFPVFLVLGLMGALAVPLDLMTITIAAVSVGIAVDHTIHYVYRFRAEFAVHRDYRATLHRCHAGVGRAMFYTSVTIVAGFLILMLSSFIPTLYFGLFTSIAMVTALAAAVTLLPYLLVLVKPFGREHHS